MSGRYTGFAAYNQAAQAGGQAAGYGDVRNAYPAGASQQQGSYYGEGQASQAQGDLSRGTRLPPSYQQTGDAYGPAQPSQPGYGQAGGQAWGGGAREPQQQKAYVAASGPAPASYQTAAPAGGAAGAAGSGFASYRNPQGGGGGGGRYGASGGPDYASSGVVDMDMDTGGPASAQAKAPAAAAATGYAPGYTVPKGIAAVEPAGGSRWSGGTAGPAAAQPSAGYQQSSYNQSSAYSGQAGGGAAAYSSAAGAGAGGYGGGSTYGGGAGGGYAAQGRGGGGYGGAGQYGSDRGGYGGRYGGGAAEWYGGYDMGPGGDDPYGGAYGYPGGSAYPSGPGGRTTGFSAPARAAAAAGAGWSKRGAAGSGKPDDGSRAAAGRRPGDAKAGAKRRSRSRSPSGGRGSAGGARARPDTSPLKSKVPEYIIKVPTFSLTTADRDYSELVKRYPKLPVPSDFSRVHITWPDLPGLGQNPMDSLGLSTVAIDRATRVEHELCAEDPTSTFSDVLSRKLQEAAATAPDGMRYAVRVLVLQGVSASERESVIKGPQHEGGTHLAHVVRFITARYIDQRHRRGILGALGGFWDPTLDGGDPSTSDAVLRATATRHVRQQAGVDLSRCQSWLKVCEVQYMRSGRDEDDPESLVKVVMFCVLAEELMPSAEEWPAAHADIQAWRAKKAEAEKAQLAPKAGGSTPNKKGKDAGDDVKEGMVPPPPPGGPPPPLPDPFIHVKGQHTQEFKIRTASTTLHSLLDYDEDDEAEITFELCVFAEAFHELISRDYAISIMSALSDGRYPNQTLLHQPKIEEVTEDKEGDGTRPAPAKKPRLDLSKITIKRTPLQLAFKYFDRAGCGYMKPEDLRRLLHNTGTGLPHRIIKQIVTAHLDRKGDKLFFKDVLDPGKSKSRNASPPPVHVPPPPPSPPKAKQPAAVKPAAAVSGGGVKQEAEAAVQEVEKVAGDEVMTEVKPEGGAAAGQQQEEEQGGGEPESIPIPESAEDAQAAQQQQEEEEAEAQGEAAVAPGGDEPQGGNEPMSLPIEEGDGGAANDVVELMGAVAEGVADGAGDDGQPADGAPAEPDA